jgi:hypothetical protein
LRWRNPAPEPSTELVMERDVARLEHSQRRPVAPRASVTTRTEERLLEAALPSWVPGEIDRGHAGIALAELVSPRERLQGL